MASKRGISNLWVMVIWLEEQMNVKTSDSVVSHSLPYIGTMEYSDSQQYYQPPAAAHSRNGKHARGVQLFRLPTNIAMLACSLWFRTRRMNLTAFKYKHTPCKFSFHFIQFFHNSDSERNKFYNNNILSEEFIYYLFSKCEK